MTRRVFVLMALVLALAPFPALAQPVTPDELDDFDMEARGFVERWGSGVIIAVQVDAQSAVIARLALRDGTAEASIAQLVDQGLIDAIREVTTTRDANYDYADAVRIYAGVTTYYGVYQTVTLYLLAEGPYLYAIYEAGVDETVMEDYIGACVLRERVVDPPQGFIEFDFAS